MKPSSLHLLLALSLATLAACSGAGDAGAPSAPASTPEAPADPPASDAPPIRETIDPTIVSSLKNAGVDVEKLPDSIAAVGGERQLTAVMRSFTSALGTTCDGCHGERNGRIDYELETSNKRVARKMWSDFVSRLQRADGGAIYCDSCHQGKMKFLVRDQATPTWMKANFVEKLARRDGQAHDCATCHGEPFNEGFVEGWRK
ncbi:MAG: hypothetical protein KF819_36085 [Labilithrix sp.]|nr:hypothetical protein [Labilithrix sp.]